jgi:hypothetical protein
VSGEEEACDIAVFAGIVAGDIAGGMTRFVMLGEIRELFAVFAGISILCSMVMVVEYVGFTVGIAEAWQVTSESFLAQLCIRQAAIVNGHKADASLYYRTYFLICQVFLPTFRLSGAFRLC